MNGPQAAEMLRRTLAHVPGVVKVESVGANGDSVLVLTVAGCTAAGPRVWCGYPVRVVREGCAG